MTLVGHMTLRACFTNTENKMPTEVRHLATEVLGIYILGLNIDTFSALFDNHYLIMKNKKSKNYDSSLRP